MKVDQYSFLREVALFEQLSDEELAEVAGMFRERTYRKNDIVFFEEDTGNYMYIVKEGRVKVSRLLPNGKEMILAFRETGEYFGEMSLLDGGTSAATVTAVIPSTILFTTQRDFQKLLSNASINTALLRMLCSRCREAWSQIEVLTFHNADARIRDRPLPSFAEEGCPHQERDPDRSKTDAQRTGRHDRHFPRNRNPRLECTPIRRGPDRPVPPLCPE